MKKFSEFSNRKDVYKLSPDYDDHIIMTRDITLFDTASPFKIDPPPANDSDETRMELSEIADRMELASSEEKHKAQEYDIRYSDEFIGYCIHHDLPVNEKKIMRMVHEMSAIDRKVKYNFNRPRPEQMANILGIRFPNAFAVTADTPSYPSGHSAGSRTLALYLSNLFPSHKQEFLNMAEECGMSRIILGVHFPSDHEAGVSLGEQFYERLKDKT